LWYVYYSIIIPQIFIFYLGAGYFGLQRYNITFNRIHFSKLLLSFFSNAKDKVHRTIEDELVEAFVKVGAIPQAHADDMSKVYI
jgi:hypothetical protein